MAAILSQPLDLNVLRLFYLELLYLLWVIKTFLNISIHETECFKLGQYCGCWTPGSLFHKVNSCHDIYFIVKFSWWSFLHIGLLGWYGIMVPDSKVHGANMGPTWVQLAPDGPHVGPMNFAIRGVHTLLAASEWRHWQLSLLSHRGLNKVANILQTTFLMTFKKKKNCVLIESYWNLNWQWYY